MMRWNKKSKFWKCYEMCYIKMMETYYVSCKKNTAGKISSVRKIKKNRLIIFVSNFAFCGKKNINVIKN